MDVEKELRAAAAELDQWLGYATSKANMGWGSPIDSNVARAAQRAIVTMRLAADELVT